MIHDNGNTVYKSRESFPTMFNSQANADELSSIQQINLTLSSKIELKSPCSTTIALNNIHSNDEKSSLVKKPKIDCKTRPSRMKAANIRRKRGTKLDRTGGKQIIQEIMTNELTQRDKSLIQRAFALGIKKFIRDEKCQSTKKFKCQRSSKNQTWTQIMKGLPQVSESDVQWNFNFSRREIEQHPFHDITMKY